MVRRTSSLEPPTTAAVDNSAMINVKTEGRKKRRKSEVGSFKEDLGAVAVVGNSTQIR